MNYLMYVIRTRINQTQEKKINLKFQLIVVEWNFLINVSLNNTNSITVFGPFIILAFSAAYISI